MAGFPRVKDIGNEQFMVCGYCHEYIYYQGEVTNISPHIRQKHYRNLPFKIITKEVIELKNKLKNDSNVCWITQMADCFPEILIYVYNYENFIKQYKHLKTGSRYHVLQKSTKVTDFIWHTVSAFHIQSIDKIHISDFCSFEKNCRHYNTLLHCYGYGWVQVPVMTASLLLMFYHLMTTEQKKHFYNFKTVHEMINN